VQSGDGDGCIRKRDEEANKASIPKFKNDTV
jgi:hypothetical protein